MTPSFVVSPIQQTAHRGGDDLLSAGLGLAGLRGAPSAYADPLHPTPAELRRRAIQASWKGIADLGPLGGYGSVYGAVPDGFGLMRKILPSNTLRFCPLPCGSPPLPPSPNAT